MKYLKTYPDKCTAECRACEKACSNAFFKEENRDKSAIKVIKKDDVVTMTACNQCGKCIPMCPAQAITINAQGVVVINKKECAGCLICVAECPCGAMGYHADEPVPFKCIACGICVGKCAAKALEIVKEDQQ